MGLLLGNANGLAGLGGSRLLRTPLCACSSGSTLIGGGSRRLRDSVENSGLGVPYPCGSAKLD
jgi:hypothetical protein